jgi:hypothetical protein
MKARFVKLPLGDFIRTLVDLYERGVDYVDLVGESDAMQDFIEIHFTEEYMSPTVDAPKKESLSDEDLNQII